MFLGATTVALLSCAAGANAGVSPLFIDEFTNPFLAEEFFTGSIPQPGTIVPAGQSFVNIPGLEVGSLWTSQGAGPGDVTPPRELRASESHAQSMLDVLGGSRTGTLNAADPNTLTSRVSVSTFATDFYGGRGVLSFSTAFGTQGILDLTYDANGAGLDQDLSGFNNGSVALQLVSGDLDQAGTEFDRPIPAVVTLTSNAGEMGEAIVSASVDLLAEGFYFIDFAQFAGIDFSDIDKVELRLDQSAPQLAAADFAIANFQFVPQDQPPLVPGPGASALALIAGAMGARRRR
ncbi:MAG: hypothetical protein Tsb0013_02310 [Phycisphaerales bacterium]